MKKIYLVFICLALLITCKEVSTSQDSSLKDGLKSSENAIRCVNQTEKFEVWVVDSCEYLYQEVYIRPNYHLLFVHKANCKNCINRNH